MVAAECQFCKRRIFFWRPAALWMTPDNSSARSELSGGVLDGEYKSFMEKALKYRNRLNFAILFLYFLAKSLKTYICHLAAEKHTRITA